MDVIARHRTGGQTMMTDVDKATIDLASGDELKVKYRAADGTLHVINITAQHMVLIAQHEASEKAIVCRPAGAQTVN